MPLQLKQPGDLANNDVAWLKAEPGTRFRMIRDGKIRVGIKAAEDGGVLIAASDSGGDILAGHGFGDRDKVGGYPGCAAFSGAKDPIRQCALEGAEGRSVDRMDDNRNTRLRGGEAAED